MAPPTSLWARQSIGSDISSAKQTFSSWDGCMAKDYCKYPVIAVIIVASLIALSVLFCIVRCCCCGLECCCGPCSCCNACCPSPRNRRDRPSKYADQPGPYNNAGYQNQAPLSYGGPAAYGGPAQYAQFDTGRKNKSGGPGGLHADALPAMPSWDTATSHRVPDDAHHEESHEMNEMPAHEEQKAPMLAHQAPSPGMQTNQFGAGAAAYHDQAGNNPDSFRASAIAPTPYAHATSQSNGQYSDAYARQDEQNPLARYGQTATPAPIPTASPLAHPQSYSSTPNPYGEHSQYEQGYNHRTSYGIAEAPSTHTHDEYAQPMQQSYGHTSPPPQQSYRHTSPPPQHSQSSPPPQTGASNLPQALQNGQSSAQAGYQAYGSAYSQAKPAAQYTAYNPSAASDATSTQYEPQSYHSSAAGYEHHGYRDV